MTGETLESLAAVLAGSERLLIPINWPTQPSTSSSSSPFTNIFRKKASSNKLQYCTLEVYDLTGHPVTPNVNHRAGCMCERVGIDKRPDDKGLTRGYLGRWYESRCSEKDGLQRWYWDILADLCKEWDMELPERCAKPTWESVNGN